MTVVSNHGTSNDEVLPTGTDRRGFIRIGGLSVATVAVIAACGSNEAGAPGRVGNVEKPEPLPDPIVSDISLLRTASSLEHSAIDLYDIVLESSLLDDNQTTVAQRFKEDHQRHAKVIEGLTEAAGGVAWTCANPRIQSVVVDPSMARIFEGVEASDSAPAIPPSDDALRDLLNFTHAMESTLGSTYQSLVQLLADPQLRLEAIRIGADECCHSALLALTINQDRPGGYVSEEAAAAAQPGAPATTVAPTTTVGPTTTTQDIASPTTIAGSGEAPPATEIPSVTAIPGQFGFLGAIPVAVGAPDENGTRLKLSLETPSLNAIMYEYMDACPEG